MPENKSQRRKTYRGDHQNCDAHSPPLAVRSGVKKAIAQPAFERSSYPEKTQCRDRERDKRCNIAASQESDRATCNERDEQKAPRAVLAWSDQIANSLAG